MTHRVLAGAPDPLRTQRYGQFVTVTHLVSRSGLGRMGAPAGPSAYYTFFIQFARGGSEGVAGTVACDRAIEIGV